MSALIAEADPVGAARVRASGSSGLLIQCRPTLHLVDIRTGIRYVDIGAGANGDTGRNTRTLLAESHPCLEVK